MKIRTRPTFIIHLLVLLPASAALYADPQIYSLTDLGTLTGPISGGNSIDGAGRVAGLSMLADSNFHAALWDGSAIDLGVIGSDTQSIAYALNNAGQVVGVSYNYGDLQPHAFMWQGGVLTSLGNFSPRDMNNSGAVVGHKTVFNAANLWVDTACRWAGGTLSDLGTLGGYTSDAFAINDSGDVVGQSFLPDNVTLRACAWIGASTRDLGTLAGTTGSKSAAADINAGRQVVGWSDTAAGEPHACLFQLDANGLVTSRTDLGVLGTSASYAYGINSAGDVVGSSDAKGFIWSAGAMLDLNSLVVGAPGWTVTRANGINDAGVIVGEGVLKGFAHAIKLTPIQCLKGDVNGDGLVDGGDVQSFSSVLVAGSGTTQQTCAADVANGGDGVITFDDLPVFVDCLLAGGCN